MRKHMYFKNNFDTLMVISLFFSFFLFFFFSGPHPWHMEIPRLGIESELQLLVHTTATAMQDPSLVCGLHQLAATHWIFNH